MSALRKALAALFLVFATVAFALTPGERIVLFSGIKPVWQCNLLAGTLCPGLTWTVPTTLRTLYDSTGKLVFSPNNLFTYSSTMVTNWSGDRVTFAANSTTAPDGTNTANTLTVNATGNYASYGQPVNTVVGSTYIYSLYVKAGTSDKVTLYFGGTTITAASVVSGPGSAGSLSTGVIFSGLSSSQWSRIQVTAVPATSNRQMSIYPNNWNINTTGDSIYVWGPQLEAVTYQTSPSTYNATTSSAYYAPRLDTNPSTLSPAGLLVEEARTNLLPYSNLFTSWTITAGTPTGNLVGPDGVTNSGWTFTENASGSNQWQFYRSFSTTSGTYTMSAFVKAGTQRYMQFGADTGTHSAWVTIDTTNFSTSTGVGGSATIASAPVVQTIANGWYRVSFAFTLPTTVTTYYKAGLAGSTTPGSFIPTYAGTSKTGSFYGIQLEAGSFPTSYIPTAASTVQRTADVMTPTTYASNATIWQRLSESAGTTARTYYAPGALPSPFPTGYWYQSMAAYSRALTTAEQTPRLVNGANY